MQAIFFLPATVFLASSLAAQTPKDQLAKPPADATAFTILSTAGTNGHAYRWAAKDGTQICRESILLRGMVSELDETVRLDAAGIPTSDIVRGVTPQGDAAETFKVENGVATWKSQVDAGSHPFGEAFYATAGGTMCATAIFLPTLLHAPARTLPLLPGGSARAEKLTDLKVGTGNKARTVTAWAISGMGPSPFAIWANPDGTFFGMAGGLAMLPPGYEADLKPLMAAQDEALARQSPALLKKLLHTPPGPVAFTHVRAFVEGTHFADDQTVLVDNGTITAVGPAASIAVPQGAQIFEGAGKTLVPGLWDSHMHVGDDFSGPFLLSLGITSARDPGNDNTATLARAKRRAAGDLLIPNVYPSVLIDGKGPNTAQLGVAVASAAEAVAAVDKAKAEGFTGIKFYGSYNPAWVAAAAAQAHKLGLHVHGHVPAGMRPSQAIASGYDEITHIYFVSMEAMPDDVVNTSNGINRFNGTGKYLKDVDLSAPPIRNLLATMTAKKIASDPTLVVAESLFVPENGDLSPAYAPYAGTLPPTSERGFRAGGFAVPAGYTRADFRKSFAKLSDLVAMMHRDGISIVAGTDGSGMELVRELELYVNAGFTPAEALEAATVVPAHMLGVDARTGSIAIGKTADLVLVEGDPSTHIGALRNTRTVMLGGKLMDADELRTASGFSGRPHDAR